MLCELLLQSNTFTIQVKSQTTNEGSAFCRAVL